MALVGIAKRKRASRKRKSVAGDGRTAVRSAFALILISYPAYKRSSSF
jgi:hypothetical protein